jgi:hypothetical protein
METTENKQNVKTINQVPLREAVTKEEKLLLGFLKQECDRIGFGTIVMEFTVRNGKIDRIKSNEISRSFNVGGRDA